MKFVCVCVVSGIFLCGVCSLRSVCVVSGVYLFEVCTLFSVFLVSGVPALWCLHCGMWVF